MTARFARTDATFESGGWRCAAWIYEPEGDGLFPCVVLAHGWSGVREQRLGAFAERFAGEGMAAGVFDYRPFGASEGQPRQLLDIRRQLEDWTCAVAFARSLPFVDSERVALWGTSFSGGHVQEIAARDERLAAVVALVPFADGLRNLPRLGPKVSLQMTREGLRDQIGSLLGRPPHMLASVGPPGALAVMTSPDAEPGFQALNPPELSWRNEAAARVALRVGTYRPITKVAKIGCPILFAIANDDVVTPTDLAEK